MDLKGLSDAQLVADTKRVIRIETSATVDVIRRFYEIDSRELYLENGYSSLFDMATECFGYDGASAQRRINAVQLMKLVPSLEAKLESHVICLQVAADIQTFLNFETKLKRPYSADQAAQLLDKCSAKSVAAVRMELASRNPKLKFREKKRLISADRIEIRYAISMALDAKHNRLKQLWSHSNPSMTHEELVEKMTDLALDAVDPLRKMERVEKRKSKRSASDTSAKLSVGKNAANGVHMSSSDGGFEKLASRPIAAGNSTDALIPTGIREPFTVSNHAFGLNEEILNEVGEVQMAIDFQSLERAFPSEEMKSRARYISAEAEREILKRNEGQGCVFESATTGKRCGAKHFLQYDHIKEWSRGGGNGAENLRVYCAAHNRWRWRNRKNSQVRSARRAYEPCR